MGRTRGVVTTRDGTQFYWGPRTMVVDVASLALDPPAAELHVSGTTAVLVPADGTRPWRVPPHQAVAIVALLNDARRVAKQQPLVLPAVFRRAARHTEAATTALPWATADALGYPGRTPDSARQTLYVHRTKGDAALVTVTTEVPLSGSLAVAASVPRTRTVERVSRRAAVVWLVANGHAAPAVLIGGGHDTTHHGDQAGG